jgi:hypothetical protein
MSNGWISRGFGEAFRSNARAQAIVRLPYAYSSETCHPFHVKAATQTGAKLPPIGA